MAKETEDPTFEDAMSRLEGLVEKMESEKLPLDELLIRYEEGIQLVKLCSEKLTAAEQRIEVITREAGGKVGVEPLDLAPADVSAKTEKKSVSLS